MKIDFGRTAGDYGAFRAGFPDALFDRLAALGVGLAGQRVLDVGTGTGALARGFAARGCTVTGLDPSTDLMAEAKRLDGEAGVAVDYVAGKAEDTGQADEAFAVASAGQCWHWFDGPRAAAELRRVLVPGGRLAIAHFDWIPLAGNVVAATEALIGRHDPEWRFHGGSGLHGNRLTDAANAGFTGIETFSFDVMQPYSHEAWRGRIRASAGVGASLASDEIERFDAQHAALLAERFPADPLAVHHRCFAMVCRRP